MALDFPVGTDFPANGNQIPDGHQYDSFYWDATAGAWKRLCEEDRIGDCLEEDQTVCDRLVSVENNIIELEEEFENLLPSLDRGSWRYNEDFTKPPGKFGLRNDVGGLPVSFDTVAKIILHATDDAGEPHGFGDIKVDSYIQLFQDGSSDTAIYHVDALPVASGDEFSIEVSFVRAQGDYPELEELFRFKFYEIVGGDAGAYVLKTGDQMTGELEFYTEQADGESNYNTPSVNTKDIRFSAKRLDTDATLRVHLYQPGYNGAVVCSGGLMARSNLYTSSYLYATTFNSDGTRVTKNPRIYFNRTVDPAGDVTSEYGAIRWGGSNRVYWDDERVEVSNTPLALDPARATEDHHAIHKGYVDKVIRMAGLQLGMFQYVRSSDSFSAGSIKSNTSTNPANITQLSIWKSNINGVFHGADFYEYLIVPGMFLHFMDKGSANYVGKITAAEKLTNGIKLTLNPVAGEIVGSVYLRNQYDVIISYNRFGFKFP